MKQSCDTALSLQHPPEGPLVPFLTVLATALRAQAYAEATVGRYVRLSADFSRWLKEKHVALANIGPSHVSRYSAVPLSTSTADERRPHHSQKGSGIACR